MTSELLQRCRQAYTEAESRARKLYDGLSPAQANWKPGPRKWSANQCLQHMARSASTYAARMAPAIDRSAGLAGTEPYGRGTLGGRIILSFLRDTSKPRRAPAPRVFRPDKGSHDRDVVLAEFIEATGALRALAERADGLALGRIRFGTPVSRLLRVSLAEAFEIQAVHHLRHIAQAERVTQHSDFPRA